MATMVEMPQRPQRCTATKDGRQCRLERFHDVRLNATPHDFGSPNQDVAMNLAREFFAAGWMAYGNELGIPGDLNDPALLEWFNQYLQQRGAHGRTT